MTPLLRSRVLAALVTCCLALAGCKQASNQSGSAPGEQPSKPPAPLAPLKCTLDPENPGPFEHGGRARVRLEGPGVKIDASDVPAICGPLYNQNAPSIGVVAGQGLLFQTCLPDGLIQISADQRVLGRQVVHAGQFPRGTDVIFEKHGGSSYSTKGAASDEVVMSDDFKKVVATVELHEIEGNGVLRATLTFDCTLAPK